jgi:hypothetical protein
MTAPRILTAAHAFVQNLRRGHYEIATDEPGGSATRHRTPPTGHRNLSATPQRRRPLRVRRDRQT